MRIRVKTAQSFSANLNRGSVAKRCYPWASEVIDWSVPIDNQHLYMPAGFSFLDGTPLAMALSLQVKSFVTRWEFTQMMRNNGIGEHLLNQALLSLLHHTDFYDPAYRYMLHEVAEECQHMGMFNEWVRINGDIRTQGAGQEFWGLTASVLTPLIATRFPPLFWVLTILFEVFGDQVARSAVHEPNPLLHPIVYQMNRAHMIEETRHVAFATEWLRNAYGRMSRFDRRLLRSLTEQVLVQSARIGMPLPYTRQLAPYVTKSQFHKALRSPHRKALFRGVVGATAARLQEIGVVSKSFALASAAQAD